MDIHIKPIAWVQNARTDTADDFWGNVVSQIVLDDAVPSETLDGIDLFSHIEVVFYFHLAHGPLVYCRHPRGNKELPLTGIFAQRAKDRPNHIGITTARLLKREDRTLFVDHFDGINGTPVVDIKPVMKDFLIDKMEITEPAWVPKLMQDYWSQ